MQKKSSNAFDLISERVTSPLSQDRRATKTARRARAWLHTLQDSRARVPLIVTGIVLVFLGTIALPLRGLIAAHED